MQDKMCHDDSKEDVVSCDRCEKENCYCKKCSSIMNESIADYANMFAQHQNSNLSEKSIIDKDFDNNNKQSHCANMPNTNIMNNNNNMNMNNNNMNNNNNNMSNNNNAVRNNKKKDDDHPSTDYPETKKHEYFFDKLDNILESLNTEWL